MSAPVDRDPRLSDHVPLAVAMRGDAVESVHYGSVAVVDSDGRLLFAAGDPHAMTFTRSALKPLQALPFVRDGGPERFGFDEAQVALLCASHSGEPRHVDAVADMLARAGNAADDLACGIACAGLLRRARRSPAATAVLAARAQLLGQACGHARLLRDARLAQARLCCLRPSAAAARSARAVADFAGMAENGLRAGIDGCSAPNYAMPLANLALAFARLATAEGDDPRFGRAPARLRDAMVAHPEMVSGERRSDLLLSQAGAGDWIAKIGAEGVQAIGVRSRGWGVASRSPTEASGACSRRSSPSSTSWACSTAGGAHGWLRMREPHGVELPGHADRRGPAGRCAGQARGVGRKLAIIRVIPI